MESHAEALADPPEKAVANTAASAAGDEPAAEAAAVPASAADAPMSDEMQDGKPANDVVEEPPADNDNAEEPPADNDNAEEKHANDDDPEEEAASADVADEPTFEEGAKVIALQGSFKFEAKVLETKYDGKTTSYLIHYKGYSKADNEWVVPRRLEEHTKERMETL